jgi:MFS family permease
MSGKSEPTFSDMLRSGETPNGKVLKAETTAEGLLTSGTATTLASTSTVPAATVIAHLRTPRAALTRWVAFGAFGGLTWGAALRALMVVFALQFGEQPQFTWHGTFVVILLPSALMGVLLGAAAYLTERSGKKRGRWAILAPLLLVIFPLLFLDGFIPALITTGLGGGAIFLALLGVLGGYAFSSFGRGWMRWGLGIFTVSLFGAAIVFSGGAVNLGSARDGFALLYFVLLLVMLIGGVSLPSHLGRDTAETAATRAINDMEELWKAMI